MGKKLLAQVPVGTIVDERFDERAPEFATAAQGTKADGAAQKGQNLSDLADKAAARTALDVYSKGQAATAAQGAKADAALPAAARGASDGVASLVGGKVPTGQVPLTEIAQSDEVHNELAAEANRSGSPFRVALTRSARKPVGRGEILYNFDDYNPLSSTAVSGNVQRNDDAMAFLLDDLDALDARVYPTEYVTPIVQFGPGAFRMTPLGARVISRRTLLVGSGEYATLIMRKPDTTGDLLTFTGRGTTIRDIGFDGAGSADATGGTPGDLIVLNAPFAKMQSVYVNNAPRDGISIGRDASAINTKIVLADVRNSKRYGLIAGAGTDSTDVELAHVNIGFSGLSGFRLNAASTSLVLCHSWGNGIQAPGGSTDYDGFYVAATGVRLTNCEGETNIGAGLSFRTGAHRGQVSDGRFWGNVRQGVYATGADHGTAKGVTLSQNGITNTGGSAGPSFAGMVLDGSSGWSVNGNVGQDFAAAIAAPTYQYAVAQAYPGRAAGILTQSMHFAETGTSDRNTVTGNTFLSTTTRSGTPISILGVNDTVDRNGLGDADLPKVASAATIKIPAWGDVVEVTGTANISSIDTGRIGRRVTLFFSNATPGTMSSGSHIVLRGGGTFAPSQNWSITLVSQGSTWYEVSRTV